MTPNSATSSTPTATFTGLRTKVSIERHREVTASTSGDLQAEPDYWIATDRWRRRRGVLGGGSTTLDLHILAGPQPLVALHDDHLAWLERRR